MMVAVGTWPALASTPGLAGDLHRIRHHETTVAEVSDDLAERLFARMFAFIYRIHGALCQE
jgi:hypothetical protein